MKKVRVLKDMPRIHRGAIWVKLSVGEVILEGCDIWDEWGDGLFVMIEDGFLEWVEEPKTLEEGRMKTIKNCDFWWDYGVGIVVWYRYNFVIALVVFSALITLDQIYYATSKEKP